MPNERQKNDIKVTDKRIFTADGDIREEFREEIRPSDPSIAAAPAPASSTSAPQEAPRAVRDADEPAAERRARNAGSPQGSERRRSMADKARNPGTPFANFIQSLIAQAYMMLGMLPSPYQAQQKVDAAAARELIDILSMLQTKTAGNLTPDEEDLLATHLGDLKLAFVQVTKNIS